MLNYVFFALCCWEWVRSALSIACNAGCWASCLKSTFSVFFQAVSLIAHYLQVPLRYPLHLGGSHSYINDYAPSIEPSSSDLLLSTLSSNTKPVEFPLFLDGQDTTRAAYAVFLLNKVIFFFVYYLWFNFCTWTCTWKFIVFCAWLVLSRQLY